MEMEERYFRVRLTLYVTLDATSEEEAKHLACEKVGVQDRELAEEISSRVDMSRMADVDVLRQYRMLVMYTCCEEGRTYGYEYEYAKNAQEARFLFSERISDDIESSPVLDEIECYDEELGEWFNV